MKRIGQKISFIVLLFILITGIAYFSPSLFINTNTDTLPSQLSHFLNKTNSNGLEKEYTQNIIQNLNDEIQKTFSDLSVQIYATPNFYLVKEENQIRLYGIKNLSILLIIKPKTQISEKLLSFQTNKIKLMIAKKTGLSLQDKNTLLIKTHFLTPHTLTSQTVTHQLITIVLVCLLFVSVFLYTIPLFLQKRKFKKTYTDLSLQINLLCENSKIREDNQKLLSAVQKISDRTPEITLHVIRRYLMSPPSIMEQTLFSPPQQAAIILVCVGEKILKKIFKRMAPQEITLLQKIIASLGQIRSEDKNYVLSQFLEDLNKPFLNQKPIIATQNILPTEQALEILKDETTLNTSKNIWKNLEHVSNEKITMYLKKQSPQSIAIILYNLSDEKAGNILNLLPENLGGATLLRLTALKSLTREQLKTLESGLEIHFFNLSKKIFYRGWQKATSILSIMHQTEKNKLIQSLSHQSPQAARRLERQIICFDDFAYWDENAISYLIKKTPKEILLSALMGADNKTKETFSKNIPPKRWCEMFKQLNTPQPYKLKEINEAQCFIIKKARLFLDKQQLRRKK